MGITKKEAFEEPVKEDLETMGDAEGRFKKLEEKIALPNPSHLFCWCSGKGC